MKQVEKEITAVLQLSFIIELMTLVSDYQDFQD